MPLLVEEATSARVTSSIRAWRRAGTVLTVPSLFWLEITNSLLIRHRRPGSSVIAALRELDELELETVDVDRPLVLAILDVSERHLLTGYDAAYVALAEGLDAPIFSADRAILAAAGDRAIPVESDTYRLSEPAPYERSPTWPQYREVSAFLGKLRADVRKRASSAP
jgi:predicted nucleic acid-binding protein